MMNARNGVALLGITFLTMFVAPSAEGMIKHVFVFDAGDTMVSDRLYFEWHSQECVRLFGPWLRRYWSYRLFDVPEEADRFNVRRGRMTELWYESFEDWKEADPNRNNYYFESPPPGWDAVGHRTGPTAALFVPAKPTEDFLDQGGKRPREGARFFLRWLVVFRYPDGVSVEDGEEWYLNTHVREAKSVPGLLRFASWRVPEEAKTLAEYGHQSTYHRLTEMWFENYDAWRRAFIESPPQFTAPPWDKTGDFAKYVDMVSAFVGARPDVDFLHDRPRIP